jgi:hypothetical protein
MPRGARPDRVLDGPTGERRVVAGLGGRRGLSLFPTRISTDAVAAGGAAEALDRPVGAFFDAPAGFERGDDDGQVRIDGLEFVVEIGRAHRSCLDVRNDFSMCRSGWETASHGRQGGQRPGPVHVARAR